MPNPPSAGPFLFLARSLANAGLASVYAAACLAYAFKRSDAEYWKVKDREYQLSRPP